jgi:hypothetical protein
MLRVGDVEGRRESIPAGERHNDMRALRALLASTGDDSTDHGGSFTGTNVQELGIDEPDIIKTDGKRNLVVGENRLSYVDISGREPRIAGELKIPGVSTYLHPVGDHMVLGVGQDATEGGRTTGLKLSLFDVSDPAEPREVSVWTMPDSYSPAENDHRAFQMFGSTAIVPVQNWNSQFNGVILFDIGDSITEIGRVSHVADSDCRALTGDDVPEDSELWWLVNDPSVHLQRGADSRGRWGDSHCEVTPVDEIRYWYVDETVVDDVVAALGATPDERFEICYPNDYFQAQIQRSLVANEVLWTMSPTDLQANDLASLQPIVTVGLR